MPSHVPRGGWYRIGPVKPKPGARKAKKQLFCIRRWSIPSGPLQAPLRLVLETLRMGDCRRQTLARQSRNLFIIPFPRRNILPTDTYLGNLFITLARSLAPVLHPRCVQPPRTGVNPPPSLRKRLRPPLDLEPLSTGTSQPAAISRLYSGGSNLSRLPAAAKQRLLDFWQQRLSVCLESNDPTSFCEVPSRIQGRIRYPHPPPCTLNPVLALRESPSMSPQLVDGAPLHQLPSLRREP